MLEVVSRMLEGRSRARGLQTRTLFETALPHTGGVLNALLPEVPTSEALTAWSTPVFGHASACSASNPEGRLNDFVVAHLDELVNRRNVSVRLGGGGVSVCGACQSGVVFRSRDPKRV
jgi:hypothetical protein